MHTIFFVDTKNKVMVMMKESFLAAHFLDSYSVFTVTIPEYDVGML